MLLTANCEAQQVDRYPFYKWRNNKTVFLKVGRSIVVQCIPEEVAGGTIIHKMEGELVSKGDSLLTFYCSNDIEITKKADSLRRISTAYYYNKGKGQLTSVPFGRIEYVSYEPRLTNAYHIVFLSFLVSYVVIAPTIMAITSAPDPRVNARILRYAGFANLGLLALSPAFRAKKARVRNTWRLQPR